MKKVILAISIVGLITISSCKKEEAKVEDATENATQEVSDVAEDAAEDIASTANATADAIPTFSNPEVQKFAEEYASYYNEVAAAAKSGDATKVQELQAKGLEWAKKSSEFTQKMTAEDAQKWVAWSQKIAEAAQN